MRNFLQIMGLAFLLVLAAGIAISWADETPLWPDQVVAMTAQNSQAAVMAATDTLLAAADVQHARATLYPTLNLQGQYITRDNQPEISAGPLSFPMGNQSNGEYQVLARELLWNGGQRNLAITAARQNLAATRAAGMSRVQTAQLEAMDRYLTALDLVEQGGVLNQSITTLQAHLKDVENLFDQGLVARNDLLETQVRLDKVQDARAAVANNLVLVLQDLNRRLGRDPQTPISLPDSLPTAWGGEVSLAADLCDSLPNNLDIRAAQEAENTSRTLVDLARKAWYPNLFLSASHTWQENDALVHSHVNSVALGVSWDIFDGGSRAASSAKAAARVLAARRNKLEAQRGARMALENARLSWQQAKREETTAHANVTATKENLRIVSDQYHQGLARSTDVLDAENLLANSRLQVIITRHQSYLATARFVAVTGQDLISFYQDPVISKQGSIAP